MHFPSRDDDEMIRMSGIDDGMPVKGKLTPAMEQYHAIKEKYPDTVVLFHMGDFYETFGSDAELVSRELDIVLTSRSKDRYGNRIPLAGVPCHAVEGYIARLVGKGYRVAVCDQTEDPKLAKGLVRRDVVRVITPGTVIDSAMLRSSGALYLMAVAPGVRDGQLGVAFLDISTGEFFALACSLESGPSLRSRKISARGVYPAIFAFRPDRDGSVGAGGCGYPRVRGIILRPGSTGDSHDSFPGRFAGWFRCCIRSRCCFGCRCCPPVCKRDPEDRP